MGNRGKWCFDALPPPAIKHGGKTVSWGAFLNASRACQRVNRTLNLECLLLKSSSVHVLFGCIPSFVDSYNDIKLVKPIPSGHQTRHWKIPTPWGRVGQQKRKKPVLTMQLDIYFQKILKGQKINETSTAWIFLWFFYTLEQTWAD